VEMLFCPLMFNGSAAGENDMIGQLAVFSQNLMDGVGPALAGVDDPKKWCTSSRSAAASCGCERGERIAVQTRGDQVVMDDDASSKVGACLVGGLVATMRLLRRASAARKNVGRANFRSSTISILITSRAKSGRRTDTIMFSTTRTLPLAQARRAGGRAPSGVIAREQFCIDEKLGDGW